MLDLHSGSTSDLVAPILTQRGLWTHPARRNAGSTLEGTPAGAAEDAPAVPFAAA